MKTYLFLIVLIIGITTFCSIGTHDSIEDIIPIPGAAVGILLILVIFKFIKYLIFIFKRNELRIVNQTIEIPHLKLNIDRNDIMQISFDYSQKTNDREIKIDIKSEKKQLSKGFLKDMFDFDDNLNIKTLFMDGFSPIDVYFVKNLIQKTLYSNQ